MLDRFYRSVVPFGRRLHYVTATEPRSGKPVFRAYACDVEDIDELLERNARQHQFITLQSQAEGEGVEKADRSKWEDSLVCSFVFDLDVAKEGEDPNTRHQKYTSEDEIVDAIAKAISDGSIATPNFVVRSGSGGAHLWYMLRAGVPWESWKSMYRELVDALHERDFRFDAAVCSQPHMLIRAPGSMNVKPGVNEYVDIEQLEPKPYSGRKFRSAWNLPFHDMEMRALGSDIADGRSRDPDEPLVELGVYPQEVLGECRWLKDKIDNGTTSGEGLLYNQYAVACAMMRHIEDGETLMQEASKDFARYDPEKTTQLMSDTGLKGPHNCRALLSDSGREADEIFDNPHCNGCPNKDAALADKAYPVMFFHNAAEILNAGASDKALVPTDDPDADDDCIELPETFYVVPGKGESQMIQREKTVNQKQQLVTVAYPFFWIDRAELDGQGLKHRRVVTELGGAAVMAPEALNDLGELRRGLARADVTIKNIYDLQDYYHEMCRDASNYPVIQRIEALGWQPDHKTFAAYDLSYSMSGESEPLLPTESVTELTDRFQGRLGSVMRWSEIMAPLFEPGAESLLFPVMYSLGSTLLKPLKIDEVALVSLYSHISGTGKTSCLVFSSSLWGKPVRSHVNANDTSNYKVNVFSKMNNLPVMIDEVTTISAEELEPLIYSMVGGFARGRAARDGANKERQSWRTCFLMTTNNSVWMSVGHQPAAVDRVLEVEFDKPPLDESVAQGMLNALEDCHGVVGPAFFDRLRTITPATLTALFAQSRSHIKSNSSTNDRFTINAMATSLTALKIYQSIEGVEVPEDCYKRLALWCRDRVVSNTSARRSEKEDAAYLPSDFYSFAQHGLRHYPSGRVIDASFAHRETPHNKRIYRCDEFLWFRKDAIYEWLTQTDRVVTRLMVRRVIKEWTALGYCEKGRGQHLQDVEGSPQMLKLSLSVCIEGA